LLVSVIRDCAECKTVLTGPKELQGTYSLVAEGNDVACPEKKCLYQKDNKLYCFVKGDYATIKCEDDGKTPVRGGSRQRKKTDGEVFEMWLENYPTDEIETNDNNEISIEEFSDEHFEGEKQE